MNIQTLKIDVDSLNAFLQREFPQWTEEHGSRVIATTGDGVVVELPYSDSQLRPGGTLSGPTMMGLADTAMYAAVLSRIGPVALAVTTNLNINFLRKAPPGPVTGHCRLLKLGSRLAVTDCDIKAGGSDDLIAQASATYSLPPKQHHG